MERHDVLRLGERKRRSVEARAATGRIYCVYDRIAEAYDARALTRRCPEPRALFGPFADHNLRRRYVRVRRPGVVRTDDGIR